MWSYNALFSQLCLFITKLERETTKSPVYDGAYVNCIVTKGILILYNKCEDYEKEHAGHLAQQVVYEVNVH